MSRHLTCAIEPLELRIAPAFAAVLDLGALNGASGFKINGEAGGDYAGYSVSAAGDVNGDGFADLLVGAYGADPGDNESSGATYVVFGKAVGFTTPLNLSSLNGSNGFRINGLAEGDYAGHSVNGAGDINGDGFADLLIGAFGADPGGAYSRGTSYVVFGKAGGFGASLDLSALDGANGFKINGEAESDYAGFSVSGGGDINGDGFTDLLIGASNVSAGGNSYSGAMYVVFGRPRGFAATLNLGTLNGNNGFKISGQAAEDYAGSTVSAAGDVNGDGFDDILIGAYAADNNGAFENGATYVVFGHSAAFPSLLDLSTLDGANGLKVIGESSQDYAGSSVSGAGDINGDGFDDFVIGASGADPSGESSGASYVVFGMRNGFPATLNLSALDGINGFKINGVEAGDNLGVSVSAAGDINGDRLADLVIGAPGAGANGAGTAYVIFGRSGVFGATLDLATLNGAAGFEIRGEIEGDSAGNSVSRAGDINGDGFGDLLIGAPLAGIGDDARGAAYVIFGRSPNPDIHIGDAEVVEGDNGLSALQFIVSLDGASLQPVTVSFTTVAESATAGVDYAEPSLSIITFAPGELSKTILVDVVGDTNVEPHETLTVHLFGATNAAIVRDTALGSILNDDGAIRIADAKVAEGDTENTVLTFSVTLDQPTILPVTVALASADGTAFAGRDFTALLPTVLTFAPGETTKSVSVQVTGDTTSEDDETFTVLLFDPSNATIADGSAVGTIVNDETLLRISNATALEGNSGMQEMAFSVILTSAHTQPVTVDYAVVDGSATAGIDYTASASGTLTFAPGETIQNIAVVINGDSVAEPTETFSVLLTHSVNATIESGSGVGTIVNDDGALSISDASVLEGHAGTSPLTFVVSLAAPSALPVTVNFAIADNTARAGSDYKAPASGTLVFAPGETTHLITAEVIGDTALEPTESFAVVLSGATNAVIEDGIAAGTILNDDVAILTSHRATFTDVDGDLVTMTVSKGSLTAANFVLVPTALGAQLAMVTLNGDSSFQDADLEITAERIAGGDGKVNVGYIDATGIDLGHVIVEGDLAQIDAGDSITPQRGLLSLHAQSLGRLGLATQLPGGSLHSDIDGALGKLKISGDITDAAVSVSADVGSIVIAGDVLGGSIRSDAQIGAIRITGSLMASGTNPAIISALGTLAPDSNKQALAIAGIHVGGSINHAEILAGYDRAGAAANADVRIGKITVRHDWIAGNIVAGADAGPDGFFGTDDDSLIPHGNQIIARIASILIQGATVETEDSTDHFGVVAEHVTSLKSDGAKIRLTRGPRNDLAGMLVNPTDDVTVLEVP